MKKNFEKVYQFKITLNDIKPPLWRRIQVPEIYTFWDLHVAIQDSMGWSDYHLHLFDMINPSTGMNEEIGIPDDDFELSFLPGWERNMPYYFSMDNLKAVYLYDFGDAWEHTIKLEKILPRDKGVKYPVCTGGKRACPPEDCGGIPGYIDFLEIIMEPGHEEYESTLQWVGGDFDPEGFNAKEVHFDDPGKRRKKAFDQ